MKNQPMPRRKGNRTTFNYTKELKEFVEERQKTEEEKRNFDYKLALSSLGIETL